MVVTVVGIVRNCQKCGAGRSWLVSWLGWLCCLATGMRHLETVMATEAKATGGGGKRGGGIKA